VNYPPCAQTGKPPCTNDAGETVDPSRGPWWAHPMVTKFTAVRVPAVRVQPVQRVPTRLRGIGFAEAGSCPDAFGNDPCAGVYADTTSGDYCIELSSGSSFCFSVWTVAIVAGVGIFALAMLSGGKRRR
jgi:hypothetical protein